MEVSKLINIAKMNDTQRGQVSRRQSNKQLESTSKLELHRLKINNILQ